MYKADFKNHIGNMKKASDTNIDLTPEDLWKSTRENLKLMIGTREFSAVLGGSYIEDINNGVVQISCDATYKREKVLRDYQAALKQALFKSSGYNFEVEINVKSDTPIKKKMEYEYHKPEDDEPLDLFSASEKEKGMLEKALITSHLNPKYLFSNFIVGTNNRLADAVAQAVVEDLGNAYNPVFFYGNTGLGKTHLMQAIGNEILKKDPHKKVVYISIEQFLNEMVEAIRTKKNEDFRNKYRAVDLLIIDDVQFVETYPRTQEELFHTFNTLYQANKQIVLASDRPPKEIKNITERLRSRFEGGMVADIQAPDYETRVAILRQSLSDRGVSVPDEYIDLIAKNIETNIRELEGALTKVVSLFKLGVNPSYEDISKILQIDLDYKRKKITPAKVISSVSEIFDVKPSDIKGNRRTAYVALCRQIVMYILRKELELPLERVAREVNRKDHTTVLHACEKIKNKLETDSRFEEKIQRCFKMLRE
ncbi:MAG: chromosomal replication initiator protein DnaA [Candidatus Dojkabacteria bacterium]